MEGCRVNIIKMHLALHVMLLFKVHFVTYLINFFLEEFHKVLGTVLFYLQNQSDLNF